LIAAGSFAAFTDGLRFVHATRSSGLQLAVASSSKNANSMLRRISVGSRKTFSISLM
jgi:hypothetical protein